MKRNLHAPFLALLWLECQRSALLLTACLSLAAAASAAIDEPANQAVWRLTYGVTDEQFNSTAWLAADDDGDGASNQEELNAGTDPFQRESVLKVSALSGDANTVSLSFATLPRKLYYLQAAASMTSGQWSTVGGAQVMGDGTGKTLIVPRTAGAFFRLMVDDVDSDKDGLSDWAEQAVGLDPKSATSNGQVDRDGLPVSDSDFFHAQLGALGQVSISAVDASAERPAGAGDPPASVGTLRVTRQGFAAFQPAATVGLAISGTAVAGTDYSPLPTSLSFAAGESAKEITVSPLYNPAQANGVSVVATLQPAAGTTITGPGWAAVIVEPSHAALGTGLLARFWDTASPTLNDAANYGQAGTYTYTRNATKTTLGTIVVAYTSGNLSALKAGHLVKVSYTSGNLNNATYNNQLYTVTAVTGSSFTVGVTGTATLPASSAGNCHFCIQSFPHPPVVERVDPWVNFDWGYGTPNNVTILPNNNTDNFSATWEGYLQPATAGVYSFQLDADDKARVLLDLNDGNGLQQILEFNWDTPATVGTFKQSAGYALAVPANAAARYKIRVELVETTGDTRCRLQWRQGTAAYANIPQANVFTHTQAATYAFKLVGPTGAPTGGLATITLTGHGLVNGDSVKLDFSASNLAFPNSYSGTYTVANATANTFDVAIAGAPLPAAVGAGQACLLLDRPSSATTGLLNRCYANTGFAGSPGRVGIDGAVTAVNNGIWGAGSPAPGLIQPDTFTARWTGQVQPEFSEIYTLVLQADDGCALWVNGVPQPLKMAVATSASGSTYSYNGTTGETVVNYAGLAVVPNSFTAGEIVRLDPTSGNLNHAATAVYTFDGVTGDCVVDYSALVNVIRGGYAVGETVPLAPSSGPLNGLGTIPAIVTAATSTTFTVNLSTSPLASGTGNVTLSDVGSFVITSATPTTFTVNWGTGKAATGTGNVNVEIANKPLKDWLVTTSERYVRLPMTANARYDIRVDYFENTTTASCRLSWYSQSQPKQIIPTNRLYPASQPQSAGQLTSTPEVPAVVGGPLSYTIGVSNGATVSISGQPGWLTLNGSVLSGTPPAGAAGDYQVLITITTAAGSSTSVLRIHVDENSAKVNREYWQGLTGSGLSSIPLDQPPTGSAALTSLQAPTDFGENYGARIRGYITAPATGNYYFWLSASDDAELWISNDREPINKIRRAAVSGGSSTPLAWSAGQKSAWIALEGGQKYYFEALHRAGVGTGDNLAIGWLKPGQSGDAPSEVIPAPVLSPYVETPALANPGAFYVATMLSQNYANTKGVGTSTLRLNADETVATMRYAYANLSGPITSQHIHTDPYLSNPSTIVFDIDTPATPGDGRQLDGSYKWTLAPVGTLSVADIREIIKEGKAYINLHTALYPAGEIRGNYTREAGSRTFTPPPVPLSWADDHASDVGAARFLSQATFGVGLADIAALKQMPSYEAWIDDQFAKPVSTQLDSVLANRLTVTSSGGQYDESLTYNAWWRNAMTAPDQLRQRVAFALSEIHVVSAAGPLDNRADALSFFYDRLAANAFGNFRQVLEETTLAPAMGRYLDMLRNDKPDTSVGRIPNENYAREIQQLFSIGLHRVWPDGSLMLNSHEEPIDTYTQREIVGFAHVFTGWDYGYAGVPRTSFGAAVNWIRPMREVPARHFTGPKRLLNNEVLPGLATINGQPLDAYATHTYASFEDAAYQALPAQEMAAAHEQLFRHPNTAPFIVRQLIQRLVTSSPSREYIYRVVQKFEDNGAGVRGDMKAVLKAILLDYEARSATAASKPDFGKQREPVLLVTSAARAFQPASSAGTFTQSGSHVITVNLANKLSGGNNVYLYFQQPSPFVAGDSTPTSGVYQVLSTPAPTANSFAVNAKGWLGVNASNGTPNGGATGTYTQTEGSNVMTISVPSHWLPAGGSASLDFATTTTGTPMQSGIYVAATSASTSDTVAGSTFTITAPDTTARTGFVRLVRFQGAYGVTDSGLAAPRNKRITLDTTSGVSSSHHLMSGDHVYLNFTGGSPRPLDGEFIVEGAPDANTFTVLTTGISNAGDVGIFIFPLLSQPVARSGVIGGSSSTFLLGNTNGDFDQSPLNSPTVFNFFLPDYKFPGELATRGMTTPEFQLTAETTVVRRANFLYNGIFNPANTTGLSSFKSGSNALVLDFSPWMGNATNLGLGAGPQPTQPWTSNANLPTLIEHFQTLLVAGQLPAATKATILNFLYRPIAAASTGNPCRITAPGHGLLTGDSISITGVTGSKPVLNGTFTVTKVSDDVFTIPVNCTTAPTTAGLAAAYLTFVPYNDAAPTDAQKRDRLRTIAHLLLTSPDFIIQR